MITTEYHSWLKSLIKLVNINCEENSVDLYFPFLYILFQVLQFNIFNIILGFITKHSMYAIKCNECELLSLGI